MTYKNILLNKGFLYKSIIPVFLFVSYPCHVKSQRTLTVGGNNWTVAVPSISEAGSNYSGTYESANNQVLLNASVPLLLGNGKVTVRYEPDPSWDSSLILYAKRTGNGTTACIACTITGGTSYIMIPLTDVELFRIQATLALASYTNIPVQLQLSGVSVTIPARTYNSRIIFTIGAL